jgi:lipopolysaccharide/colanic/teichoic acid biosynthesis glycosyltransferase/glycosyltransferase involved in cell wall biosynthesis
VNERDAPDGPLLPFVSVVLPIRNEAAFIGKALTAVLAQDYPHFEVLVADGMSDDGTARIVRALAGADARVRVLDNPGRIVATGLNAAVKAARGDIVVRVDGHCEIAVDYVRRCVEHLGKGDVWGVGGPLETIGQTRVARAIAAAMSSRFGVGNSAFRTLFGQSLLVDTVAFPAYPRRVLELAGPFDEELVRNQDDEYNYRLRKMGGRLLLAADVRARYFSRSSLRSLWRQYFQYGFWKVRVLQKHPRQMSARQFVPPVFVLAIASLALSSYWPAGRMALALLAAVYATLTGLAAFVVSRRAREPRLFAPLVVSFPILHLSYGSGFLVGLVRFWRGWNARSCEGQPAVVPQMPPVRRAFDCVLGSIGLLLAGLPLGVAALAIRLTDGAPVLYRQTRVGRGGRPFCLYKLRTMRISSGGSQVTAGGDARITPVGHVIRRLKIDELPQLWNVVRGDLSVVGPRPEVPFFVDRYDVQQRAILEAKPGLASVAALVYADEAKLLAGQSDPDEAYARYLMPAKIRADLAYERIRTLGSDIRVLFELILLVLGKSFRVDRTFTIPSAEPVSDHGTHLRLPAQ